MRSLGYASNLFHQVKFDLGGFKKVQSAIDPTLQHWVRCSPPEHSFNFQYANELEKV
jgi:hypothetical protein